MNVKHPKVSVLTPVMNVEPYIAQMIESIQNQTYQDWELIIMDGLSKDQTVKIAQKYAKEDERIMVYSEKDESPWHAVDKMFDLARADFITIVCGQDGMLDDKWLEEAMRVLDRDKEISLVWGLAKTMTPEGRIIKETHVSYAQFVEKKSLMNGVYNVIKKIITIANELIWGTKERKKILIDKLFSRTSLLRVNLLAQTAMPKGGIPQKKEWFWYWLKTGLVFPDQSMIIDKKVFLSCIPRYQIGSKTLGYMTDFYFNFNANGYLAYFLPIDATFGRMHPGQSGERASQEMHKNFKTYLSAILALRKRIEKSEKAVEFKDRNGVLV